MKLTKERENTIIISPDEKEIIQAFETARALVYERIDRLIWDQITTDRLINLRDAINNEIYRREKNG